VSDFGTLVGEDRTLTTASPAPPPTPAPQAHASAAKAKVSGSNATVRVSCTGQPGTTCRLTLRMTVTERFVGHRLVAVTTRAHTRVKVLVIGTASVTLSAGQAKTVRIALNSAGKRLLAARHTLKVRLRITQASTPAAAATVSNQVLTFKAPKKHHH
jgi:hypothetical protein